MTYAIIYEYSEIISEIMCTKVPDAEISIMCVCGQVWSQEAFT